jgi:SSS family solute:Na+ symporter
MFWKRSTGHGAFWGLFAGTVAPAIHHGISLANGATPGVKGGFFGVVLTYPSDMAQTFWTAIAAFTTCFLVTIVVSLATTPRPDRELEGLVYSLTPKQQDDVKAWYEKPSVFALVVLAAMVLLNVLFF